MLRHENEDEYVVLLLMYIGGFCTCSFKYYINNYSKDLNFVGLIRNRPLTNFLNIIWIIYLMICCDYLSFCTDTFLYLLECLFNSFCQCFYVRLIIINMFKILSVFINNYRLHPFKWRPFYLITHHTSLEYSTKFIR